MTKFNPRNERIKRAYVRFLKEADRKAEATIRGIEKSLRRYEACTGFADFGSFNADRAASFKKDLATIGRAGSKEPLSLSTIHSTLNDVKRFFKWLACQTGYKAKIRLTDIEFLNLADQDARAAKAPRPRDYPTIEQVRHVIFAMPVALETEMRDRALIVCALLTGMRDGALATIRVGDFDLDRKLVVQDPRHVRTKFRKRIDTYFLPLGDDLEQILSDWITYLRQMRLFGPNDPVFPRTAVGHDQAQAFIARGIEAAFWETTSPIRHIFRRAFEGAGLAYYNPHSIRHTLVVWAQGYYRTPEEFKAFSQNIGHESPLTTFVSYGRVSLDRQGKLIRSISPCSLDQRDVLDQIRRLVAT
jgi:integrase